MKTSYGIIHCYIYSSSNMSINLSFLKKFICLITNTGLTILKTNNRFLRLRNVTFHCMYLEIGEDFFGAH